jgi:hypothetical protein
MNCRVTTCITIGSALLANCLAYADPVTLPGVTEEYHFDDGAGTGAIDSVGGNNASLQSFGSGNSQWITGFFGGQPEWFV